MSICIFHNIGPFSHRPQIWWSNLDGTRFPPPSTSPFCFDFREISAIIYVAKQITGYINQAMGKVIVGFEGWRMHALRAVSCCGSR